METLETPLDPPLESQKFRYPVNKVRLGMHADPMQTPKAFTRGYPATLSPTYPTASLLFYIHRPYLSQKERNHTSEENTP